MFLLLVLGEGAIVGSVASANGGAFTAAIVGGVFLTINAVITVMLPRILDRGRDERKHDSKDSLGHPDYRVSNRGRRHRKSDKRGAPDTGESPGERDANVSPIADGTVRGNPRKRYFRRGTNNP
jgi:hypothetical protein